MNSSLPRWTLATTAVLAASALGCTEQNTIDVSEVSAAIDTCTTAWVCGSNSPEIDHYGFHELNTEGQPNLEKIRIATAGGLAQISKGGVSYALKVQNSRILATKEGQTVWSGQDLVGAEIRLFVNDADNYTIRIEAVRTIAYPVGHPDTLEAYALSWYSPKVPPDGKRLICTPPTILASLRSARSPRIDDELLGMRAGETVVFEGDRIDAQRKTMDPVPNDLWFNLGCAGHTLAKLHLTRHTLASGSDNYGITDKDRQATLKMLVADYCGDGHAFTVAGEPLRWKGGLVDFYTQPSVLEARWTSEGASCLYEPRLKRTTSTTATDIFGPDIEAAIAARCAVPRCTDPVVDNFDGALRVSGNP